MILYDLVFIIFTFLYLPYFILKRKYHREFVQRLGILPRALLARLRNKKIIWLHAVSVGEVNAALPLYNLMRKEFPQYKIVFSTITKAGNNFAKKFIGEDDACIYFPLDLSFIVRRVLGFIKPRRLIILETELWPNFISQCKKIGTPIFLVNARISDAAFRRYKLVRWLLRSILNKIELILAQTQKDAQRFIFLGAESNRVKVTGNMKFDIKDYPERSNFLGYSSGSRSDNEGRGTIRDIDLKKTCLPAGRDYTDYRLRLGLKSEEKLFITGSTHPGEEEIILSVYKELLTQYPNLRLLIAPRHIERISQIERLVFFYGFSLLRISRILNSQFAIRNQQSAIFLIDTIGQLKDFYSVADIVFIGGSLIKRGGHNIIEPAMFSKPIISGRYFFNFSDIFRVFLDNQAILISQDREELKAAIFDLLNNPEKAERLGRRAKEVILRQQGATQRNLEWMKDYLS